MGSGPLRCAGCGGTDFFVISAGVSYSTGTMVEHYRWPERGEEVEPTLDEMLDEQHVHDGGYHVDQSMLEEPSIESIEGPIRALCGGCLRDMTDEYLRWGRAETLPV